MAESPICKRLKEARLAAGLSQKKLGIAAGMDEFSASSRMNHYEIGRHQPDFETLKRIGKVLKVPVAYFYAESDDVAKAIALFYKMSKTERARFLKSLHVE
ncbi:MAG: helix-turn-helix transcriptional regulator [Gammaproteobacteria bacterium]|nr:helix-turn-helix transcriptional regulator [Gammaproteobacteria bacterium]